VDDFESSQLSPGGLLQFSKGEAAEILASVLFGICTTWPNREKCRAWTIAERCGYFVGGRGKKHEERGNDSKRYDTIR